MGDRAGRQRGGEEALDEYLRLPEDGEEDDGGDEPERDEGGPVAVALAARGALGAGGSEADVADEGGELDEDHQHAADGDSGGGGPHPHRVWRATMVPMIPTLYET